MKRFSPCPNGLLLAVLLTAASCGRGPGPHRLLDFRVEFGANSIPAQMAAGETLTADVAVKNISTNVWPSKPDERGHKVVNLSYHWLDQRGEVVVFDGLRTPLPHDVGPGESVRLKASIEAPERAGRYTLEVTLVQEAVAWFPERDGDKLTIPIRVVKGSPAGPPVSRQEPRAALRKSAEPTKRRQPDKPAEPVLTERKAVTAQADSQRREEPAAVASKSAKVPGRENQQWTVQAAAFAQRRDAESLAKKLRDKNYDAYIVVFQIQGRDWHRVRVGRLATRGDAEKLQDVLKLREHITQAFVARYQ